jgi:hypothetical protein
MSLLSTASPWNNDKNTNKKRIPTMRKQYKLNQSQQPSTDSEPPTIEGLENANEERNNKVNKLLDQITSLDSNEENGLSNYEPLARSSVQCKSDHLSSETPSIEIPMPSFAEASIAQKDKHMYNATQSSTSGSDYKHIYQPATNFREANKPYYANMGLGKEDDKLMERINYMIHMLENQQHEKTEHITEEFLLYTFLGIFVIYVVDSFSRVGKYTR